MHFIQLPNTRAYSIYSCAARILLFILKVTYALELSHVDQSLNILHKIYSATELAACKLMSDGMSQARQPPPVRLVESEILVYCCCSNLHPIEAIEQLVLFGLVVDPIHFGPFRQWRLILPTGSL